MKWGEIFIEAAQLAVLLKRQLPLQIFDCRFSLADAASGRRSWQENHIADAAYLHLNEDLSAPIGAGDGRHPLLRTEHLHQLAKRYGIAKDTLIICYDEGGQTFAARAWYSFRQHGYYGCRILNGGMRAWNQAHLPAPLFVAPLPREFPVRSLELDELLTHASCYQPVDAREPARFRGEVEPIDPYAGCLPGAVNRFWQDCFAETGHFIPHLAWHHQRWQELFSDRRLVNYCGSGVTALANIISLLVIGKEPVLFYPGGWSEYCIRHPRE